MERPYLEAIARSREFDDCYSGEFRANRRAVTLPSVFQLCKMINRGECRLFVPKEEPDQRTIAASAHFLRKAPIPGVAAPLGGFKIAYLEHESVRVKTRIELLDGSLSPAGIVGFETTRTSSRFLPKSALLTILGIFLQRAGQLSPNRDSRP